MDEESEHWGHSAINCYRLENIICVTRPQKHEGYRSDQGQPARYERDVCDMYFIAFRTLTKHTYRTYNCSLTNRPAIPIPVPMHILVNRTFFFCLLHSLRPVTIWRAPVQPSG
jgi:hypothetical protein